MSERRPGFENRRRKPLRDCRANRPALAAVLKRGDWSSIGSQVVRRLLELIEIEGDNGPAGKGEPGIAGRSLTSVAGEALLRIPGSVHCVPLTGLKRRSHGYPLSPEKESHEKQGQPGTG